MKVIDIIKENLENVAFLITRGESDREAHRLIIKSIMLLDEIDEAGESSTNSKSKKQIDNSREVKKVARRLNLWARRQEQFNSRILNAYLELKEEGNQFVSEPELKERADVEKFEGNFNNMRVISPKNHGKIFEMVNGYIEIWKPIQMYVNQYKEKVFVSQGK